LKEEFRYYYRNGYKAGFKEGKKKTRIIEDGNRT